MTVLNGRERFAVVQWAAEKTLAEIGLQLGISQERVR
jgi:DNA-binding CsgD family transcriptional regulator